MAREPDLADPGTLMATTHEVDTGLRVRLRLTRPSDATGVATFLQGLSSDTRRGRFGEPSGETLEGLVRHFTFYDPRRRLVVAAAAPVDGAELLLGLADVAFEATGTAELGVVVDDRSQHHGVGRLLCEAVASLALRQGATHLRAELRDHNTAMARLMQRLGRTSRVAEEGRVVLTTRLPGPGRAAA
jgi:acetyltransferase